MNPNPLIVALDVPDIDSAASLAKRIDGAAGMFKIGMELFYGAGPEAVRAFDGNVFLDLKLHDIPTTVARAMRSLAPLRPSMVNVHALGGRDMMRAAVEAKPPGTKLVAVTILTSLDDAALAGLRLPPASEAVPHLARLAADAGCDGVVCAPVDVRAVRDITGDDFIIVTPGVRPAGGDANDQARVATPRQALSSGATYIVVGRPITGAADPRAAAEAILEEIA